MIRFAAPLYSSLPDLILRLSPTQVEWTYNLNYNIENTYGGQVVQILSINFDRLVIEGQFGREGPHGIIRDSKNLWTSRQVGELFDYKVPNSETGRLMIGITQMTEWFKDYFTIASQGHDADNSGNFDQYPVHIIYDGGFNDIALTNTGLTEREWRAYPVDFPSYSRAIDEFTPRWHIEFEVEQADYEIQIDTLHSEINKLKSGVGFTPFNPFSDPLGGFVGKGVEDTLAQIRSITTKQENTIASEYDNLLNSVTKDFTGFIGNLTPSEMADLIATGASIPNLFQTVTSSLQTQNQSQNSGVTTDPSVKKDGTVSNPKKDAFNHR